MMLYAAFGVLALIVIVPMVTSFMGLRKYRTHEARRQQRQRTRTRDWAVMDWLYRGRGKLRITHQPAREESAED